MSIEAKTKPIHMLSIDVEDWFHLVGAGLDYQFKKPQGGAEIWDNYPSRIVHNTQWILDTLEESNINATFFILGWVAERFPELVLEIYNRGHEIASHSYWHKIINIQKPSEFREDLKRSIDVLQNIIGKPVYGFRSSSGSITNCAIDIIAEEGLVYDASIFPVTYHDVYGKIEGLDDTKPIERLKNRLWEVKYSTLKLTGLHLPWSGGGYFRLFPYHIFKKGIKNIIAEKGVFMFYLHPWEIDSEPPKLDNLKPIYRLRRYVSIDKTRVRFLKLLKEFRFISIQQALNLYNSHDT